MYFVTETIAQGEIHSPAASSMSEYDSDETAIGRDFSEASDDDQESRTPKKIKPPEDGETARAVALPTQGEWEIKQRSYHDL